MNVPLSDTWAFRASVQKYKRDGFAEIKGGDLDGYDLDDADSFTGKLAALWQPSDNFSAHAQVFMHDLRPACGRAKERGRPPTPTRGS